MSKKSWVDSLKRTATHLKSNKGRPLRAAVVGIGHELRGDDAVGMAVAQKLLPFANEYFLVVEGGHAPENHTGVLRQFGADLVLLVDAAQLGEKPGTVRWLPWEETTGLSASSHTMPPYMLARFLTAELGCEVALIGIQPGNVALGEQLSPDALEAAERVMGALIQHLR